MVLANIVIHHDTDDLLIATFPLIVIFMFYIIIAA